MNPDAPKPLRECIYSPSLLQGLGLIEASAGTGKTYSLQSLLLRLVVEHGMAVGRILVVTYTEAATRELRERIRNVLREALACLRGEAEGDERLQQILALPLTEREAFPHADDQELRRLRLERALRDFDEAAISTIHGFCARMLRDRAFETAVPFDCELVGGNEELVAEVVADFCRQRFYPIAPVARAVAEAGGCGPGPLSRLAAEVARKHDAELAPEAPAVDEVTLAAALAAVCNAWREQGVVIAGQLREAIEHRRFNKPFWGTFEVQCITLDAAADGEPWDMAAVLAAVAHFCTDHLSSTISKRAAGQGWEPPPEVLAFGVRCDEFEALRHDYCTALKWEFCTALRALLSERKATHNVQTYDDLLTGLRDALIDPDSGEALANRIRDQFDAALIDEFQDTDPVQYDIFRRLFIDGGKPIFLVGDPKQAIYGFRNGDVFTYYDAAATAQAHYGLDTNYRSETRLAEAVNRLFADRAGRPAFATRHIRYEPVWSAGKSGAASLLVNGQVDSSPLKLWFCEGEGGTQLRKGEAQELAPTSVAAEIAALLGDGSVTIGRQRGGQWVQQPVQPSDIAVLVMRHEQARDVHTQLRKLGIPAVLQSSGNVFDSTEAQEMAWLLTAMAEPANARAVRAALTTSLFPPDGLDLHHWLGVADGPAADHRWERWLTCFRHAHELWRDHSFVAAWNWLLEETEIRQRLLGLPNGERALTNFLHLAEIVHRAAGERRLGLTGVRNWLSSQLAAATRDANEEYELRLESDADAVQVMTVFKSKGLEFPIVFACHQWVSNATVATAKRSHVAYHRQAQGNQGRHHLVLHLDPQSADHGPGSPLHRAQDEQLAEHLRLLYVAVTRAVHRCYLFWGRIAATEQNALNYLLHAAAPDLEDVVGSLPAAAAGDRSEDIAQLSAGDSPVARYPLPTPEAAAPKPPEAAPPRHRLTRRTWPTDRKIEPGWAIVSFSSLARHQADGPGSASPYDFDEADSSELPVAATRSDRVPDIFSFPAGIRTGNCWHALFQDLDFTADDAAIRAAVSRQLAAYRLTGAADPTVAAAQEDAVCRMVRATLNAPLLPDRPELRLHQIAPGERIAELEFYYPLADTGFSSRDVIRALEQTWERADPFLEDLAGWEEQLAGGFVTGAVDLVFRDAGTGRTPPRYYLLDWKSNRLGGTPESFDRDSVEREMGQQCYFLQYLLYTVAVHRFLQRTVPDYSYETHFGGALYLFLRGIDPAVPGRGIYYDRPDAAVVMALDALFGEARTAVNGGPCRD